MKRTIPYKNTVLTYHIYGKGTPLILIHGFGETNTIWKNQVDFLKDHCKLIIPDLPGSGESPLFETSSKNISIDELADSIYPIIENENPGQCIMLGHSMGGYVTLAFAEKYPGKLKAFGFVHSTAFADSGEKKQNRFRGIETMEVYGSYAFLKTSIPGLFGSIFKKQGTAVINELIEEGKRFKKHSLQQYYYAMMQRPDRTHVLRNSRIPVLFVMGTEDNAAPLDDVLKQSHLPEIAYIHIIENAGHMSMVEMPERVNGILKNFIDEC